MFCLRRGQERGREKGKGKEKGKGRVLNKQLEDSLISYVFGFILGLVLLFTSSWADLAFELEKLTQNPWKQKRQRPKEIICAILLPPGRISVDFLAHRFLVCHENLQYQDNPVFLSDLYLVLHCIDCIYQQKLLPDVECKSTLWHYEPNFLPWTWQELEIIFLALFYVIE